MPAWFVIRDQQIDIKIFAKPNAKQSAFIKVTEQGMHITLHAKPESGKANVALILFLAEFFKVPKSHVILKRGETSRYKWVTLPLNATVRKLIDQY